MSTVDILPPEPAAKHVRRVHLGGGSVTDAAFVTLRPAQPRKPFFPVPDDRRHDSRSGSCIGLPPTFPPDVLERAERVLCRLSADMFSAVVALAFLIVFGLAGGFSPFLGSDGHAQGDQALDISHVTMTPQDANGMRVLLVNGVVENLGAESLQLPFIKADFVREGTLLSSELIEPPVAHIQGGHSYGFSARILHPGGKTPELRLSFADKDASRS
jgi:hypothetical protein